MVYNTEQANIIVLDRGLPVGLETKPPQLTYTVSAAAVSAISGLERWTGEVDWLSLEYWTEDQDFSVYCHYSNTNLVHHQLL